MKNSQFKNFKKNLARMNIEESTLFVASWFSLTPKQVIKTMELLEKQGYEIKDNKMKLPNGITLGKGAIKKVL